MFFNRNASNTLIIHNYIMAKQTPTINDLINSIRDYIDNSFIIIVNINKQITIPYIRAINGFNIDWGDNIIDYIEQDKKYISHEYYVSNNYIIHIIGNISHINFSGVKQLIEISQWGNLNLMMETVHLDAVAD